MSQPVTIDPRRLALAADPYRPAYHFLAPANWMNDPNGTIFWQGRYHIFYQYNPDGAYHGNIHWGHASSADLVHWTDHPVALAPTPGGPDRLHCYSGAAFVSRAGIPTLIYHGVPDGICLATSHDDLLLNWVKHPANPIIPNPGSADEWRIAGAPCAWVEGETTYALTGNSLDTPDRAYLFAATDPGLARWEYRHPFYDGGFFTEGDAEDCGCPDFFPLGDRHLLLFTSHRRGTQAYIGRYADQRFTPERHVRLAFAETGRPGVLCEGLTLLDGQHRRIFFGRLSEARFGHVQRAAGWSGIFSLPMVLDLAADGALLIAPVPELAALRGDHLRRTDIVLPAETTVPLREVGGDRLEIRAVFTWEDAEEFGLAVRCSPDGAEQTLIRFNTNPWARYGREVPPRRELILDVSRSSTSPAVCNRESQRCIVELPHGQPVELRVFVDRSVIEVFANGRHYLGKRIYPARPESLGIAAYAIGGRATLQALDVWTMQAIWPVEEPRPT